MAYSVKSSAERHTKNRHGEKRERNRRQFAGVERRRASLRNARGWRVRELLHSDADPHSIPTVQANQCWWSSSPTQRFVVMREAALSAALNL
jgi:hypothetical protein